MKKILNITSLLIILFACSSNKLNATSVHDRIAAVGYVRSEPAYSSVGKGYIPSEPAYSSVGKGYNNTNSGYSKIQNNSQTDMDKAHQEALKWIKEHPQESQQIQLMLQNMQMQQK